MKFLALCLRFNLRLALHQLELCSSTYGHINTLDSRSRIPAWKTHSQFINSTSSPTSFLNYFTLFGQYLTSNTSIEHNGTKPPNSSKTLTSPITIHAKHVQINLQIMPINIPRLDFKSNCTKHIKPYFHKSWPKFNFFLHTILLLIFMKSHHKST